MSENISQKLKIFKYLSRLTYGVVGILFEKNVCLILIIISHSRFTNSLMSIIQTTQSLIVNFNSLKFHHLTLLSSSYSCIYPLLTNQCLSICSSGFSFVSLSMLPFWPQLSTRFFTFFFQFPPHSIQKEDFFS